MSITLIQILQPVKMEAQTDVTKSTATSGWADLSTNTHSRGKSSESKFYRICYKDPFQKVSLQYKCAVCVNSCDLKYLYSH